MQACEQLHVHMPTGITKNKTLMHTHVFVVKAINAHHTHNNTLHTPTLEVTVNPLTIPIQTEQHQMNITHTIATHTHTQYSRFFKTVVRPITAKDKKPS